MRTRATILTINNVVQAQFGLDDHPNAPSAITSSEREHLAQFGDVLVDIGGTVDPATGADLELPEKQVYMPSSLPVIQKFDLADLANAQSLAEAWVELVKTNLGTAVTALLAKTATESSTVDDVP